MKTGILDSKKEFKELPYYEIQGLCDHLVETACKLSATKKAKYEEYKKDTTRFSSSLEFCLHELGWYLYDPLCNGKEEVLFSNGERCYIASMKFISNPTFDRTSINNTTFGYPRLTDENVGYDSVLNPTSIQSEGIVDNLGYVDSSNFVSIDNLAEMELIHTMVGNREVFEDYVKNKDMYDSALSYLTSKENVVAAKKMDDGKISLSYVSDNDGVVKDFIDALDASDMLAELVPLTQVGNGELMMVEEENNAIIKVA